MGVRLKSLIGVLALPFSIGVMAEGAIAQLAQDETVEARTETEEQPTILQAFEESFYRFDENFFRDQELPRTVTWFLGPFPENEMTRDGRAVHRLYVDVMTQQALADPIVRTADLTNPFDTSLLLLPTTQPSAQTPASGFTTFETAPTPPVAQPAAGPVRALF